MRARTVDPMGVKSMVSCSLQATSAKRCQLSPAGLARHKISNTRICRPVSRTDRPDLPTTIDCSMFHITPSDRRSFPHIALSVPHNGHLLAVTLEVDIYYSRLAVRVPS